MKEIQQDLVKGVGSRDGVPHDPVRDPYPRVPSLRFSLLAALFLHALSGTWLDSFPFSLPRGIGVFLLFAIPSQRKQCLLRPAHDWAMDTLRLIPMDGTYDQCKPLARLLGVNN